MGKDYHFYKTLELWFLHIVRNLIFIFFRVDKRIYFFSFAKKVNIDQKIIHNNDTQSAIGCTSHTQKIARPVKLCVQWIKGD